MIMPLTYQVAQMTGAKIAVGSPIAADLAVMIIPTSMTWPDMA